MSLINYMRQKIYPEERERERERDIFFNQTYFKTEELYNNLCVIKTHSLSDNQNICITSFRSFHSTVHNLKMLSHLAGGKPEPFGALKRMPHYPAPGPLSELPILSFPHGLQPPTADSADPWTCALSSRFGIRLAVCLPGETALRISLSALLFKCLFQLHSLRATWTHTVQTHMPPTLPPSKHCHFLLSFLCSTCSALVVFWRAA